MNLVIIVILMIIATISSDDHCSTMMGIVMIWTRLVILMKIKVLMLSFVGFLISGVELEL